MTNSERVLQFLHSMAPRAATNSEIRAGTGVSPHQQVFQITQSLMQQGKIQGRQRGREWEYWASQDKDFGPAQAEAVNSFNVANRSEKAPPEVGSSQFERLAREIMSGHYGVELTPRKITGANKIFDFVSPDGSIVGDAKFFSMVRGQRLPPAKFSIIAEYVWLLGQVSAKRTFLVFGNDIVVPREWLKRHGSPELATEFYFLGADRNLIRLK